MVSIIFKGTFLIFLIIKSHKELKINNNSLICKSVLVRKYDINCILNKQKPKLVFVLILYIY